MPSKVVPCFHETCSWLEEMEKDSGGTPSGSKGFLTEVTSRVRPEGKKGRGFWGRVGEESRLTRRGAVRSEMEREKQEPYETWPLVQKRCGISSKLSFKKFIRPSCETAGWKRTSHCGERGEGGGLARELLLQS